MTSERGGESILICGSQVETCQQLCRAICSHKRSAGLESGLLRLDNRYYTAEVPIVCRALTSRLASGSQETSFGDYAATVLYASDEEAPGLVEAFREECQPTEEHLAFLVVDHNVRRTESTEEFLLQRCIEAEVELIILEPDPKDSQEAGLRKTDGGLVRLVEALETIRWPQMKIKDIKSSAAETGGDCGIPSTSRELFFSNGQNLHIDTKALEAIWSELMHDDEAYFSRSQEHQIDQKDLETTIDAQDNDDLLGSESSPEQLGRMDHALNEPFDDFDSAFQALRIASFRAEPVDQVDEEQRRRAAQLALRYLREPGDEDEVAGSANCDDDSDHSWGDFEEPVIDDQYESLAEEPP